MESGQLNPETWVLTWVQPVSKIHWATHPCQSSLSTAACSASSQVMPIDFKSRVKSETKKHKYQILIFGTWSPPRSSLPAIPSTSSISRQCFRPSVVPPDCRDPEIQVQRFSQHNNIGCIYQSKNEYNSKGLYSKIMATCVQYEPDRWIGGKCTNSHM